MCSRSLWNIWSVDYNTQNVQKTPSPMLQKGSVREARARLKTNDPSQKKKKKKKKKKIKACRPAAAKEQQIDHAAPQRRTHHPQSPPSSARGSGPVDAADRPDLLDGSSGTRTPGCTAVGERRRRHCSAATAAAVGRDYSAFDLPGRFWRIQRSLQQCVRMHAISRDTHGMLALHPSQQVRRERNCVVGHGPWDRADERCMRSYIPHPSHQNTRAQKTDHAGAIHSSKCGWMSVAGAHNRPGLEVRAATGR